MENQFLIKSTSVYKSHDFFPFKLNNNLLFESNTERIAQIMNIIKQLKSQNITNYDIIVDLLNTIINLSANFICAFKKTKFFENNEEELIKSNQKIYNFVNEVEQYNKDLDELTKKYLDIKIKNKEISKLLQFENIKNLKKLKKIKITKLPMQLANDYNLYENSNATIKNIYFNGLSNFTNNSRNSQSLRNKLKNEENSKLQKSINYRNNSIKKSKIFSSQNSNKGKKNISYFDNNMELPFINFKIKKGDKYQINIFDNKINLNILPFPFTDKSESIISNINNMNYNINNSLNNDLSNINIFDFENFDIFELKNKLELENVMPYLGKEIIKNLNLNRLINENKLPKFLITLSNTYQNTKTFYHTSLHAIDVCYNIYSMLSIILNYKEHLNISENDILSLIIGSMGHDTGHPGYSNKFLTSTKNELAIIYNDASVLENYHCAKLFQLLEDESINIFDCFNKKEYNLIREKIIKEILATDISCHNRVIQDFNNFIEKKNNDIQYYLNYILHFADIAHNHKKFEISIKWVELLSKEFWREGDIKKDLGIELSPLEDRTKIDVPNSQLFFISTFSMPMAEKLANIYPKLEFLKKNGVDNLSKWKELAKNKRKKGWTPEKKGKNDKSEN